jgi:hypothetical protein
MNLQYESSIHRSKIPIMYQSNFDDQEIIPDGLSANHAKHSNI